MKEKVFVFRQGPVPGTGTKSRWRKIWRYPRVQGAMREAFRDMHEFGVDFVRPCRRPHRLPNSWDEYIPASYGDRCWKRTRKRQWRPRKGRGN